MILEIISPEKIIFTGEVSSVAVPGVDGEFEMLNNHASIVSNLKQGSIKLYGNINLDEAQKEVFKKGDRKVEKLRRFTPDEDTVNRWMVYVEKNNEKYRKLLPTNCKRVFMEDIEHKEPFEVLEWVGIKDWSDYLNKDFCVPIQKGWSS